MVAFVEYVLQFVIKVISATFVQFKSVYVLKFV